jgi:hypothetical protein
MTALLCFGLSGVVAAALLIDVSTAFPGYAAILPVVATALILISGERSVTPLGAVLLGNKVMRWLGRISYSLYLWHWPIVVFAKGLWPDTGPLVQAGVLVTSVLVAATSYDLFERPVLESTWLFTASEKRKKAERRRPWVSTAQISVGSVITLLLVFVALRPADVVAAPGPINLPAVAATTDGVKTPLERLQTIIEASIAPVSWGPLSPSLDDLATSGAPEMMRDNCLPIITSSDMKRCLYGPQNAKHRAVVIGDSIATSWMPALRGALPKDWSIQLLTMGECPNVTISVRHDHKAYRACDDHHKWVQKQRVQTPPGLGDLR